MLIKIKKLLERLKSHNIAAFSGQMAFFFFLSFFPFILIMINLLNLLPLSEYVINISDMGLIPKDIVGFVQSFLEEAMGFDFKFLSVSFILLLWSSSKAYYSFSYTLNHSYSIPINQNIIMERFKGMVFTVVLALTVIVAFLVPLVSKSLFRFINKYIPLNLEYITDLLIIKWIVVIAFLFVVISLSYMVIPNTKIKYLSVLPGTAFTVGGWTVVSYLYTLFLNNFGKFQIVYGSLSTIITTLIWLYMICTLMIIGGEINAIGKPGASSSDKENME